LFFLKLAVSPEIFVNLEEKYIHQYEKNADRCGVVDCRNGADCRNGIG
jgi:hypothetical protein